MPIVNVRDNEIIDKRERKKKKKKKKKQRQKDAKEWCKL